MKKIIVQIFLLVAVALATTACHHAAPEEHHHDAQPVTLYSDHFELYAEMEPLVVGEESHLLVHLTYLDNFKPVDSLPVEFLLQVGDAEQRWTLDAPQQPGKYTFELEPKTAGHAHLALQIHLADTVETLWFPHTHVLASHDELHDHDGDHHDHGDHHDGDEHHHDHGDAHAELPAGAITFTKEQSWTVDFATQPIQPERFGAIIRASAQVLPSQGDEREATAKASGILLFTNPNLVEGSAVSAGQRLFFIESSGMADNNMNVKFQEVAANFAAAQADYQRKSKLAADKIVSQSDLEQSRVAYETAKAAYDNLQGNFTQRGSSVSAPISGFVKTIHVRNGAYVDAGQPVVTVSQNRDLYVRAELPSRYYPQLAHIAGATFQLPDDGGVYSLDDLGGALVSYGKATTLDNPLIPVTFRFRNTAGLLAGNFVTLYIRTESEQEVLAVPNSGIVEEMGNYFVFVQIDPEHFEKRPVTLGATDGLRTVIATGLNPGERVVTRGATMVKLAQSAGALDPHAGHVHSH